jgi:hypothetical protein
MDLFLELLDERLVDTGGQRSSLLGGGERETTRGWSAAPGAKAHLS